MSGIGPELPPHLLAKRKRKQEEAVENEGSADSGAKAPASLGEGEKRRRVLGPALPPAPLDQRPAEPAEPAERTQDSDSDDDDGFGPALPSGGIDTNSQDAKKGSNSIMQPNPQPVEEKLKRDEWMTMAPKQDDLAARMDPTKQRPRAFNTGKGARGPNSLGDDSSAWHETLEQKQKRLADEMMGVSKPSTAGPQRPLNIGGAERDEAAAKKIREHTEKTRGPSLMDQHQRTKGKDVDDDPSKRAFDRDKDMGSGMKIGHAQRKELLNNASNFSSKFSGGSYL